MNIRHLIAAALVAVVFSGCGVKYAKEMPAVAAYGIRSGSNSFDVIMIATPFVISQKTANDYALLRLADLAVANGFKYLYVPYSSKGPIRSTHQSGAVGIGTASSFGGTTIVNASAVPTSSSASEIYVSLTGYVYNDIPRNVDSSKLLDAASIRADLRKKYHVKEEDLKIYVIKDPFPPIDPTFGFKTEPSETPEQTQARWKAEEKHVREVMFKKYGTVLHE